MSIYSIHFLFQNEVENLLVESFSEDEGESTTVSSTLDENASSEIRELINRKQELEKRHKNQELHRLQVQVSSNFLFLNQTVFDSH